MNDFQVIADAIEKIPGYEEYASEIEDRYHGLVRYVMNTVNFIDEDEKIDQETKYALSDLIFKEKTFRG